MTVIERLARVVLRLMEETGMPVTVEMDEEHALVLNIDCGPKNVYAHRVEDIYQRWWKEESAHLPGVKIDCPLYCEQGAQIASDE